MDLFEAVATGNLAALSALLEAGASIASSARRRRSAEELASRRGRDRRPRRIARLLGVRARRPVFTQRPCDWQSWIGIRAPLLGSGNRAAPPRRLPARPLGGPL